MPLFFLFIIMMAAVVIALVFIGAVSRTNPARAQRLTRVLLGVGACVVGAVMSLRGLPMLGAPIAGIGLVMLGLGARTQQTSSPPPNSQSTATMSRNEALDTLGLKPGATEDDIRASYKRLIKKVHPDTGGSDALARRIQQARSVLLGDR